MTKEMSGFFRVAMIMASRAYLTRAIDFFGIFFIIIVITTILESRFIGVTIGINLKLVLREMSSLIWLVVKFEN